MMSLLIMTLRSRPEPQASFADYAWLDPIRQVLPTPDQHRKVCVRVPSQKVMPVEVDAAQKPNKRLLPLLSSTIDLTGFF
jgi:hypothetical protein